MTRCHGFGHDGSARSAPALPGPPHLLPRLRVAARVPLPLLSQRSPRPRLPPMQPWLMRLPATRRAHRPCAAGRLRTWRRSRRSMTPSPPPRLRPAPPLRLCGPRRSPLPHRPSTSRRRHRSNRPQHRTPVVDPHRAQRPLPRRRHHRRLLRVRRRSPAHHRPCRCRRLTPARRPRHTAPVARLHRPGLRCAPRRQVYPTGHALRVPVCRRVVARARVLAATAAVRAPWHRPRRHLAVLPRVRPAVVRRGLVVAPRPPAVRRGLVVIRAVVVARRASVARWIRPQSMRTSRRR